MRSRSVFRVLTGELDEGCVVDIDFTDGLIAFINSHSLLKPCYTGAMKNLRASAVRLESYTPRIIAMGLLVMLLLLSLTGCQNKPAASSKAAPVPIGDYQLISVNNQKVPCNLKHEGVSMTVKSGIFSFYPDGTCRSLSTFAVPPHADIHREVKATYTGQGAELTMHWQGAGTTAGPLTDNGRRFTMNNEGMIFSYEKQDQP